MADPGVIGVIGHLTPASTQAALPVYRAAGLAVVSPWSLDPAALAAEAGGVVSVAATTAETEAKLAEAQRAAGISSTVVLTAPLLPGQLLPVEQAVTIAADAVTAGDILRALPAPVIRRPALGRWKAAIGNWCR